MFLVARATDEQLVMQLNAQNGMIRVQLLSADFQMAHQIMNEQIFILCRSSRCYQETVRLVLDSRVND
jgi:chorismate-pyruvate lyase